MASFLDLPAEIRNQIYDLSLLFDCEYRIDERDFRELVPTGSLLAVQKDRTLLRTCRQVRAETLAMYYSRITFSFTDGPISLNMVKRFLAAIGPDARANLWQLKFHGFCSCIVCRVWGGFKWSFTKLVVVKPNQYGGIPWHLQGEANEFREECRLKFLTPLMGWSVKA
ncbi:hypothetical protein EV356DRAFT_537061 [Viridothelium virens]|uniref:F-box domain-containing protein n=1 Tax=Viridothelium virens TaxID=1048519 RepID=A0A6A6GVG5_VIRVR|nr:hypothetical protein EV356DRAFT_537061 [Viridothelium virens]